MLPQEVPLSSRSDVARSFGEDFAARALTLEPGRWQGPVESGFGLHLVFVRERVEGRLPPLSEIRHAVERDFQAARSQAELEATYERLLSGYTVVVEKEASTIQ
jgi:parvulin-like peptidyl-prolyl isomerase